MKLNCAPLSAHYKDEEKKPAIKSTKYVVHYFNKENMFNTPILFLIFNRLNTTRQVFAEIRKVQPKYLYVAADGPRPQKEGESEKCEEVRRFVLDNIDWDCEVKTLFREKNLGCGKAPAEAITWFFDNVEMGIILEDDCLPSQSFFIFCAELLLHYADDKRIMQISGTNRYFSYRFEIPQSYYFTYMSSEWGWATWKRAWNLYDFSIEFWKKKESKKLFEQFIYSKHEFDDQFKIFDETVSNPSVSWWDYQWGLCKNFNNGLTIIPKVNLISNIGFGSEATHTQNPSSIFNNMKFFELDFPLTHPYYICCDIDLDKKLVALNFPLHKPPKHEKIKKLLKRLGIFNVVKKIYSSCFHE